MLAHEILTARPYTFLDDAELQNRRTDAVHAAARPAGRRPRSGPARPRGDRAGARRGPRPTRATPTTSTTCCARSSPCRPEPEWRPWFDELVDERRAVTVAGERCAAVERRRASSCWCPTDALDDGRRRRRPSTATRRPPRCCAATSSPRARHRRRAGRGHRARPRATSTIAVGPPRGARASRSRATTRPGAPTAERVVRPPACWRACTRYTPAAPAARRSSPSPPRTSCASCCAGSTSRRARSARAPRPARRSSSQLQGFERPPGAWEQRVLAGPGARATGPRGSTPLPVGRRGLGRLSLRRSTPSDVPRGPA